MFSWAHTHEKLKRIMLTWAPSLIKKKICWGSSNQQPLWTSSIHIILRMIYWFSRLGFPLACCVRHCVIFMVCLNLICFSIILLKPDLVVQTLDFMISEAHDTQSFRIQPIYDLHCHFSVKEVSFERVVTITS